MPKVTLHKEDLLYAQEVDPGANLVVLAGIKKFPNLSYGCGMGKCTKCTTKVLSGAEHLNPPNWKEEKMLGDKLKEGYRLTCQLTITEDIELEQS
ncbi:2Fe-2S iron-sulfur cluster-binding protein [Halalkalibacter kiskunsagensis]|uniref:2Fe-2S iron-sulfur cluster-binding protein n=1 Tax=Halalkalibacter kiskunsagensis TaxID=1548599 RepID=A0ABV6KD94_9BACI